MYKHEDAINQLQEISIKIAADEFSNELFKEALGQSYMSDEARRNSELNLVLLEKLKDILDGYEGTTKLDSYYGQA
jgi:hypothetical protein